MKNATVETLIGAAVIVIAAAFFLFAYQSSGKSNAAGGYRLLAEFDNAEGINVGTDVRMAGVKVGTVIGQTLNHQNFQAAITLLIDPALQLTEDVTAKVTSEGLLGAKFISLEQGGADAKLADGGTIQYTQGAVDIWALIGQAMFEKSGDKKPGESGTGTTQQ
ncbi:MAG: outer membrane lipid asymmetry maintenance protein MlaD [Aestuariivirga sp.]